MEMTSVLGINRLQAVRILTALAAVLAVLVICTGASLASASQPAPVALSVSGAIDLALSHNLSFRIAALNFKNAELAYEKTLALNIAEESTYAEHQAKFTFERAKSTYDTTRAGVIIDTVRSYFDVKHANMDLAAKAKQLEVAEEDYARAKSKYAAGVAGELELLQVESALHNARLAVQRAADTLGENSAALAVLLGLEPGTRFQLSDEIAPKPIQWQLDQAVAKALENSVDVRQKANDLRLAQLELDKAEAERAAPLDLERARVGLDIAALSLQQVRETLTEKVRTSMNSLGQTSKNLNILSIALDVESKKFDIVVKQQKAGLKSPSDVAAAEASVISARHALGSAQKGYILAYLQFLNTLGVDLDLSWVVTPGK
jgi:outer membrane protein TolC